MDKIRNEYITGTLNVVPVNEKIKILHINIREMRRALEMNAGKGRCNNIFMECVNEKMLDEE